MTSKWKRRFLDLAAHVAEWSKDPSTKVGAVIVSYDRIVLGLGYNGFARGVDDSPERYDERSVKYKLVVHAEANAIVNSRGRIPSDATLFATKFPCSECAKLIIQSGIGTVVCPPPSADGVWAEDAAFSKQMFSEAHVQVILYHAERDAFL